MGRITRCPRSPQVSLGPATTTTQNSNLPLTISSEGGSRCGCPTPVLKSKTWPVRPGISHRSRSRVARGGAMA